MRRRCYALAAWIVAALLATACGPPSGALFANLGPREEALGYFPASTRALLLVRTDLDEPAPRELAAALPARTRAELRRAGRAHGLLLSQVRALLGHDLVVGLPRPGAPPLAVIVAKDGDLLELLAQARVISGRAQRAGSYRGATLYRGAGHAFAVREGVLLVSTELDGVRAALDRRVSQEVAYDAKRLARQLPAWSGDRPVVRAVLDAGALVASLGPRAREVSWLAAFERLGAVIAVRDGRAVASLRLGTSGAELVERDIPIPSGPRAPRALAGDGVSVRDGAHSLGALDTLARAAFPLERLRAETVLAALAADEPRRVRRTGNRGGRSAPAGGGRRARRPRRGVDVFADVVARLHGPATLVVGERAWAVRIEASRPRALRRSVDRLAARLPAELARLGRGYAVAGDGLITVRRSRRALVRFGLLGDVLVAGSASPRALRAIAAAPARRVRGARGGLALALSGADVRRLLGTFAPGAARLWPGWRVDGWLRATPGRVTGELRFPLR